MLQIKPSVSRIEQGILKFSEFIDPKETKKKKALKKAKKKKTTKTRKRKTR